MFSRRCVTALLALLFCNVCGAGKLSVDGEKEAISKETRGYINIVLESPTSSDTDDVKLPETGEFATFDSSLTVCLASMTKNYAWIQHECLKTDLEKKMVRVTV